MSDAPAPAAALAIENGVPPAAQDNVEETPGFKVSFSGPPTWHADRSHPSRFSPAILRTQPRMKG